jgi:hypothetical protein
MEPPEYAYREYIARSTLRCDMMVFVEKNTRYPDVDPWFISTTGFRFPDTYRKAARKTLRRLRVLYRHHLQRTPMGFFPPAEGRGRTWIARMRGLGQEEEEPMETHWDKGTQTENEMDRFLPIKKRSIRTEEESP